MRKNLSIFSAMLALSLMAGMARAQGLEVTVENLRHAYYRGEQIPFSIRVTNLSHGAVKGIRLRADLGVGEARAFTVDVPPDGKAAVVCEVDTAPLRAQDYQLVVAAVSGAEVATAGFPFTVAHRPNPQRLPVVYWGGFANTGWMMDWGLMHGFNTFSIGSIQKPLEPDDRAVAQDRAAFDEAIRKGANLGIYFHALISRNNYEKTPEVFAVGADGKPGGREQVMAYHPAVMKRAEEVARRAMALFGEYPNFFQSLINSEYNAPISYDAASKARVRKALGFDLESLKGNPLRPGLGERQAMEAGAQQVPADLQPKGGIIEDSNPYYRFYTWWWKEGMGDVQNTRLISDIIHASRPDVITWHDPYRLAPAYGQHAGLSAIGQWTYTFPDPKYTLYVETMIAGAKPEGQMIMPDITVWEYDGWLAPKARGVVTMPYQLLRETAWLNLSRRPDMLCHYISSTASPSRLVDEWTRDTRLFEEMRRMSEEVYQPYGPAIRAMQRAPRKVAILSSAASVLFPNAGDARFGYTPQHIYNFYSALQLAHIPADVIFDETIQKGGLKDYDVLVLHLCETLPRSVYREVLAFQKRGGVVFGDQYLRADIPTAARFDFDFSYRKNMDVDRTETTKRRLNADEDREFMLRCAQTLRKAFEGKVERFADADSAEVLLNTLTHGGAAYVFAVNDRRTYGERFGQWKTMHTEGVPLTSRLRIRATEGTILYDLTTRKEIACQREGAFLVFDLSLGPCDGTIIGVYPEAIAGVKAEVAPQVKAGQATPIRLSVVGKGGQPMTGVHPLRVEVRDANGDRNEYSGYVAAENGVYDLAFTPGVNDPKGAWQMTVTELTSGQETKVEFRVE